MNGEQLARRLSLLAVSGDAAAIAAFQVSTATAAGPSLQASWLVQLGRVSSFSSLEPALAAPGF